MTRRTQKNSAVDSRGVRLIALFAYDDCQSLDVSGPLEVFRSANVVSGRKTAPYRTLLVSRDGGDVRCSSGLTLASLTSIRDLPRALDTVLLAGGSEAGLRAAAADARTSDWVRRLPQQARRYGSVCTGAFLLGAAGLLDGRKATTHWDSCTTLAQMFPRVEVAPDAIYVKDDRLYTSAGVTAAMDLALALVEADLGRRIALTVARQLVLFLRRPGGQSQFSTTLSAQTQASHPLRDLLSWIIEHPRADLSLARLAARVHLSERHFTRRFRSDTGMTPAEFIEAARIDRARLLLEETDWGNERVAREAGFGSVDSLQRCFLRKLDVTPREYRKRFAV